MDITITPRPLQGEISIIPSKSQAHRLMICAAFADRPTRLYCPQTSQDMDATAQCLTALGAQILPAKDGLTVIPAGKVPEQALLNCRESGSTLRFLLPVVGALGVKATFQMAGRLPSRPLSPLWEEMERMGCRLSRPTENTILCDGKLLPGAYTIDGGVSSQFISGLLMAQALMDGESSLEITGKVESKPYIAMTREVIALFGGKKFFRSPGTVAVEGDWSNGAFFLAARYLGSKISVHGLKADSSQGDRAVLEILSKPDFPTIIDTLDIPDLVPVLSVVAAANLGAVFTGIRRLRLKESDRVASTISMLCALGGRAEATEDTLTVHGTGLIGGIVDAVNDHRIAMAAAIAATVCSQPVTILGAQCVAKSYPQFWEEYRKLGGCI